MNRRRRRGRIRPERAARSRPGSAGASNLAVDCDGQSSKKEKKYMLEMWCNWAPSASAWGAVPRMETWRTQAQDSERRSTLVSDRPGRRVSCRRTRHQAPLGLLEGVPPTAGPHDGLQDEAARSAALAGRSMARNGNGMDRTATEQNKQTRRTEQTLRQPHAQSGSPHVLHAGFLSSVSLRRCRRRTTRAPAALGRRRPPSKKIQVSWSTEIDVCETLDIARRWHGHDHGHREGRLVQVVLTGGTRLGRSLIRRLVGLNHDQSAVLDESRVGPAGQPGLLVVRVFGR